MFGSKSIINLNSPSRLTINAITTATGQHHHQAASGFFQRPHRVRNYADFPLASVCAPGMASHLCWFREKLRA